MKDIDEIIGAYMLGEASPEETEQLSAWIRESPDHAAAFARSSSLHRQLEEHFTSTDNPDLRATQRPARTRWLIAGAAAAALVLALVELFQPERTVEPGVATVAHLSRTAVWTDGSPDLPVGTRLTASTRLRLDAGLARVRFDNGVDVTLEGPANYLLRSADRTELVHGTLTAVMPDDGIPSAAFEVETAGTRIIDRGTAFGVETSGDGIAEVAVFDGQVALSRPGQEGEQVLGEGESVRLARRQRSIDRVPFDTQPFEDLWPLSSGVESSTGAFRFAPPWPGARRRVRHNAAENALVVPEGRARTLSEPLEVDITEPGPLEQHTLPERTAIPAGRRVRSLLLQYSPAGGPPRARHPRGRRETRRLRGSIRFSQPVLGLIVTDTGLRASDEVFAGRRRGRGFGPRGRPRGTPLQRGLELASGRVTDRVTLDADRRTLHLDLVVRGRSADHIRVILDDTP